MIRVIEFFFAPERAWQKIVAANRGGIWAVFAALLPCMLVGAGIEAFGLIKAGDKHGEFGHITRISQELVIRYELTHIVLAFVSVMLSAWVLHAIGLTFDVRCGFSKTLATIAYASAPIFLMWAPDGIPALPTWICWAVGAAITMSLLYHGVAQLMQPEQTKGFGLYLISMVLITVFTGLSHFIAIEVLHGRFFTKLPL
ncbi:MAG: hypothetical protein JWM99_5055 [Verrucomicrobiales bacterium]|jgi:hypothetical protein|nr:hypothetical protein [Verrucomicrobiales bacterium]